MTESSKKKLSYCDTQLQELVNAVDKERKGMICVCCGYRNAEEQEEAYETHKSKAHYGQSPHNCTPSKAVDLAPLGLDGKIQWGDTFAFKDLAVTVKKIAKQLGIEIEWGGGWSSFTDYPHYELKNWKL